MIKIGEFKSKEPNGRPDQDPKFREYYNECVLFLISHHERLNIILGHMQRVKDTIEDRGYHLTIGVRMGIPGPRLYR